MNEPNPIGGSASRTISRMSLANIQELRRKVRSQKAPGTAIPPLVPQLRPDRVPLSFAQERLWFLDQLGLVGAAYNMLMPLRLQGPLDIRALEASFSEVLRRHEALRTRFAVADGSPIQIIDPPGHFELPIRDLSALSSQEKEDCVSRLSSEDSTQRFDLAAGPLMRVTLLRLSAVEHVLLCTMHHIISDGWSLGVLKRELSILYPAFARGESSPLAELPVQYADYSIWQRSWIQGSLLQDQLKYWKEQLKNAPPMLTLPTDRPRPDVASHRGRFLEFPIPLALRERLEEIARSEGATLFMLFLAAFNVLMSLYSGQEDIVVGSAVAGRTHADTEGLLGFFVNTVALRMDLSGNPDFRSLLGRARQVTLDAYAHQDLPFEQVVRELRPERSLTSQPLFQVAIALQNFPNERLELDGVTWSRFEPEHTTALFDITLHLFEVREGITGLFEYSTDLFDESTLERMAGHFLVLLEGIAADPDAVFG